MARIAFDTIGSKEKAVALINVSKKEEKKAAKDILKRDKHIKSVLNKISPRTGVHRIYKYRLVAGEKNTEVLHKEYGFLLKLDPKKVYFSPREAEERQRIAEMVKSKEEILVMFSGVGPFSIAIAKKHPNCKITAVEINRKAVEYANLNNKLNKINNIENICSDARKAKLGKYNRIIMPLPETAFEFLDIAFNHIKKGGNIHLYGFSREEGKDLAKIVKEKASKKYRIIKRKKVLPYSPYVWKVRLDIKVI